MMPAGNTFLQIQYSMSAMSKDFGWVTARWATASESSAVICRVMPVSALHFSAMALRFDTQVPNWRSVTFLLFCAQMVGNQVNAPLPAARPMPAAAPLRTERRSMALPPVLRQSVALLPVALLPVALSRLPDIT